MQIDIFTLIPNDHQESPSLVIRSLPKPCRVQNAEQGSERLRHRSEFRIPEQGIERLRHRSEQRQMSRPLHMKSSEIQRKAVPKQYGISRLL